MRTSDFGRFSIMAIVALVTVMTGSIPLAKALDSKPQDTAAGTKAQLQLMFVQTAENIKVDPKAYTLRLVNVDKQTLYFSDRPQRIAGHLKMNEYLKEWSAKAGNDNFHADPPNATLSVYEPGQPDTTIAVVELTNPVLEGSDLIYNYKVIEGQMPVSGGETALFIDWIGVGGGIGPGFHGVGVGRRGFGF